MQKAGAPTDEKKERVKARKKQRKYEQEELPYDVFLQLKKYRGVPFPPRELGPDEMWVPFEVPSYKNSKEMEGRRLTHSAAVKDYKKLAAPYWFGLKAQWQGLVAGAPQPLQLEFTFCRAVNAKLKTVPKFDYVNMAQGPLDEMQDYGWLRDDDADSVKPSFGDYIPVADKHQAGVIIKLLNPKP